MEKSVSGSRRKGGLLCTEFEKARDQGAADTALSRKGSGETDTEREADPQVSLWGRWGEGGG